MGEQGNTIDAGNAIAAGRRSGKTTETVKQYLGEFTKQQKQWITEALEAEASEEEPPKPQVDVLWSNPPDLVIRDERHSFYNGWQNDLLTLSNPVATSTTTFTTAASPYQQGYLTFKGVQATFASPQKKEIEEEVQDVDFEE